MEHAASRMAGARLIKIKVDADDPTSRIEAVRRAAPSARLIVDPNESWTFDILHDTLPALERAGVSLIEQPLPAVGDADLVGFSSRIPICADEACHTCADLPRLLDRYQAINIKLDKTGGLTEAWRLLRAARTQGFRIMVGCMVGSSLGIAPTLEIAREAEFIDRKSTRLNSSHPSISYAVFCLKKKKKKYEKRAGITKFLLSDRLTVRDHYIQHTRGTGVWAAIYCTYVLVEHNSTPSTNVSEIF